MSGEDRFNLARYLLAENAARRPDKVALVSLGDDRQAFTYAQIERRVLAGVRGLRRSDARPGERLLIRLPNGPDYACAFFAAIGAGLVAVPASPQLTAAEAGYLARDSEARWILGDATLAPVQDPPAEAISLSVAELFSGDGLAVETRPTDWTSAPTDWEPTRADDPAFLIYTSGTTGYPRGVLHAQRVILGRRPMGPGWTGLGEDDRILHAGQLNWTYTMGVGVMDPFSHGATALVCAGDPPPPERWFELIGAERATIFAAVPGLYRRMLKYGDPGADLSSLRYGLTAGEALRPELYAAWRAATGTELYEALGMSEVSTYISSGPVTPVRPGSPGRPQPGRRIAVLPLEPGDDDTAAHAAPQLPVGEHGLLAVHASDPGLMLGYWNDPEADRLTRRGEWFVGGDVVHRDEDGYIYYHGRRDEMMNAFGYRVSPLEVERVLSEDPAVMDVAVAEKKVSDEVSLIAAYVIPAAGVAADDDTRRAILERAERELAAYKRPREVVFVGSLPRGANGKLRRRELG